MKVETAKPITILDRTLHRLDMRLDAITQELNAIKELLRQSRPTTYPPNVERRVLQ